MSKTPAQQLEAWKLGATSTRFETSGKGVFAISSGSGDHGGASYGAYQMSSRAGTLTNFLASQTHGHYGRQFAGLQPGTAAFNARWLELAHSDPQFARHQHQFIHDTHYEAQLRNLAKAGMSLSSRGVAIHDMVWSTSVQFGGETGLVRNAIREKFGAQAVVARLSDTDIINAVQDYKVAHNAELFRKSSDAVRAGTLNRAHAERGKLLELAGLEQLARGNPQQAPVPVAEVLPTENRTGLTMCVQATPGVDIGYSMCIIREAESGNVTSVLRDRQTDRVLASVCTADDLYGADTELRADFRAGRLGAGVYGFWTDWSTARLVQSALTFSVPQRGQPLSPIGAFYESRSPSSDEAASVAASTFRLFDNAGRGLTWAEVQARDTSPDGTLRLSELNGLSVWLDLNEDGVLQRSTEFFSLSQWLSRQSQSSLGSHTWQLHTAGNAHALAETDGLSGVERRWADESIWVNAPASDIASLRADNAVFTLPGLGYIQWRSTEVALSRDQTALLGTEGNDMFNAGYFSAYAGRLFNLSGLRRFYGGAGADSIGGSDAADTLWGGAGHDILVGADGHDVLFGESGDDQLFGSLGADSLHGGDGADTLVGEQGDDIAWGAEGLDELQGGDGHDWLHGGDGSDRLFGQVGNDVLFGADGNDILVGFTGINEAQQSLLAGQTDDDSLFGGAGRDLLLGGLGQDRLWGGADDDELQGQDGADRLMGEAGHDRLFGQTGHDTLYGGEGNDWLMGDVGNNETQRTPASGDTDADHLYGGTGADTLLGGRGSDYLDGGAGADWMEGGTGDDVYIVNSTNDVVFEQDNAGRDQVFSLSNTLLSAHLENLTLLGRAAINGTGNRLNNHIVGNSAANILDGVTGADTLEGGQGSDVYYVDHVGDRIVERRGEGVDTVLSSVSYTLGNDIENLTLLDFSKPEPGVIDGEAVHVWGYPKAFELDYMQGNASPVFRGTCALTSIANLGIQAGLPLSEGTVLDRAIAHQWCVTDPSVDVFQRGGSNAVQQQALLESFGLRNGRIDGYSEEAIANLIRGGRGVVVALNAGALWNDPAYLDDGRANHVVTVTGLATAVDAGDVRGFYIADSGRGRVSDMTRFISLADFRASANVANAYALFTHEPIKLWDEHVDATGNRVNNHIIGNRGRNRLSGLGGHDTLNGMAGSDLYVFSRLGGHDRIEDCDTNPEAVDELHLTNIQQTQLWFSQSGQDLRIQVLTTGDAITIANWYVPGSSGTDHRIERIRTSEGRVLHDSDIARFVDSMAGFGSLPATQTHWQHGDTRNGHMLLTVTH